MIAKIMPGYRAEITQQEAGDKTSREDSRGKAHSYGERSLPCKLPTNTGKQDNNNANQEFSLHLQQQPHFWANLFSLTLYYIRAYYKYFTEFFIVEKSDRYDILLQKIQQ
jgi:hypothetical protein